METSKKPPSAELCRLTEEQAREFIESIRWPDGAVCPHCESKDVTRLGGEAHRKGLFKCKAKACRKQFTVTVGTIFQGSKIALRDWVYAFNRMCASKKGVSALQLQRELGLQYRSAWFLAHRVRYAMQQAPLAGLLQGTLEMDETYVGGKVRNRMTREEYWKAKGTFRERKYSGDNKTPVVALVERNGRVRTRAVPDVKAGNLRKVMREMVAEADPKAVLNSDQSPLYKQIGKGFSAHKSVDHAKHEYHRHADDAGINTAESFFALLKRGVYGTFHNVSRRHLQRYCDEFSFRWNGRGMTDRERTVAAISQAPGKRLSYRSPIANNG